MGGTHWAHTWAEFGDLTRKYDLQSGERSENRDVQMENQDFCFPLEHIKCGFNKQFNVFLKDFAVPFRLKVSSPSPHAREVGHVQTKNRCYVRKVGAKPVS